MDIRSWRCLGVLVFMGSGVEAQSLLIEHQPVACAVAEKFPRLTAEFAPADQVAAARVVFQGENLQEWFSVTMNPEGVAFQGVLPKPKKSLKSFRYYIEVTDKALGAHRTAEFTTNVVDSAGSCKGKLMAGALSSASVILHGPAGVVALPAGFASTGVVAGSAAGSSVGATSAAAGAGGGLSTGAVVGIVAGVAAVGAGAAVAVKGGEEDNEDAGTSYSGPVSGQYTVTQVSVGNVTNTCAFLRSLSGTMKVTLGASGLGEGELQMTESSVSVSGPCSGTGPVCCGPVAFVCSLTGTSGSLACGEQRTNTSNGQTNTQSFTFTGSLSGSVVSGAVTYGNAGGGTTGITNSTHSGSTNMAVTLR